MNLYELFKIGLVFYLAGWVSGAVTVYLWGMFEVMKAKYGK